MRSRNQGLPLCTWHHRYTQNVALTRRQQLQAHDPAAAQRCEPGPKDGREKTLTGKWERGGDGNRNGYIFRQDDGENGDPGNLRNDSRGEVEQAREWVTPTGNQQP